MTTLMDDILGGHFDTELDLIAEALDARKRVLTERRAATLVKGQTVEICRGRPAYLIGLK
jgi:hypothetical protein